MKHLSREFPVLALLVRSGQIWARWALPLALVNLAWAVLSATVVLAPFATAGLFFAANRAAYGQPVTARGVWGGVRRYLRPALLWGATSSFVWLATFGAVRWRWVDRSGWLALVLVLLGLLWSAVQLYLWPLLFEQRDTGFIPALRSSLLLIAAAPGYTLTLFGVLAVLLLISAALRVPLLLVTPSYTALAANRAVLDRLALLGYTPDPARAERAQ